jgi:hypothetical protein
MISRVRNQALIRALVLVCREPPIARCDDGVIT